MFARFSTRLLTAARRTAVLPAARLAATATVASVGLAAVLRDRPADDSALGRALQVQTALCEAVPQDEAEEAVPYWGKPGTKQCRTFVACKPDCVQRGLVGKVIKTFEAKGYKLVAIKVVQPTPEFAAEHYSDLSKMKFFPSLVKYFSSGPVVAMVWEGPGVIKGGRQLVGATNPREATPGTLRGDNCVDIGRNIIHASDKPESAEAEIKLWFRQEEVVGWTGADDCWKYE